MCIRDRIRTPAEERGCMVRGKPVPALVGDGGAHRRDPERRAEGGAAWPAAFFAEPHAGHRHHGGGILSGRGAGAPAADALCKGGGGGGVGDAAAGGRRPDGAAAAAHHTANDCPGDGT